MADCPCCTCIHQDFEREGCGRVWEEDPIAKDTQQWINSWGHTHLREQNGYEVGPDHGTGFGCPPAEGGVPPCPGREPGHPLYMVSWADTGEVVYRGTSLVVAQETLDALADDDDGLAVLTTVGSNLPPTA